MTDEERQDLYDTVDVEADEIADPGDFKVKRDEQGKLIPTVGEVPGRGDKVIHLPMESGAVDRYFGNYLSAEVLSSSQKAEILNLYLVDPVLDESHDSRLYDYHVIRDMTPEDLREIPDEDKLTADDIDEDFLGFADADVLVEIVMNGSGYDITRAQNMAVMGQLEGNLNEDTEKILKKGMKAMEEQSQEDEVEESRPAPSAKPGADTT